MSAYSNMNMNTKNIFPSIHKEIRAHSKMNYETKTVKQLRDIARQRGMKGYWPLRKADLIVKIRSVEAKHGHILDAPVPDIGVPILQPTAFVPTSTGRKIADKAKSAINKFANWIVTYVPEKVKRIVNEKLEAVLTLVNNEYSKPSQKKYEIRESKTAIRGFAKQYTIDGTTGVDAQTFLNIVRPKVIKLLNENRQTKFNAVLNCIMERVDMKSGEVTLGDCPFVSKTEVILEATDTNEVYSKAIEKITKSMASFQMRGSNWRFVSVVKLDINTVVYKPLKGSSFIPLPPELASKKVIINMQNDDDECFKWCITRALNPVKDNPHRITKDLIKQSAELDWSGIEFPVRADANILTKFERNNNINVNVFGYENDVYPLYISKHESGRYVDLLLISDGEKMHYCWIKNFNGLMTRRTEKSDRKSVV